MRWPVNPAIDPVFYFLPVIFHLPETGAIAYTDKTSLQRTSSAKAWLAANGSKGL